MPGNLSRLNADTGFPLYAGRVGAHPVGDGGGGGGGVPVFLDSAFSTDGFPGPAVVTIPAVPDGSFMVLVCSGTRTGAIETPSGWDLMFSENQNVSGSLYDAAVFTKTKAGDTDVTISQGDGAVSSAVYCFESGSQTADVFDNTFIAGSSSYFPTPDITAAAPTGLFVSWSAINCFGSFALEIFPTENWTLLDVGKSANGFNIVIGLFMKTIPATVGLNDAVQIRIPGGSGVQARCMFTLSG